MNMQNESSTSALNALHSLSPSPSLKATEVELQIELFIAKCQKVLPNKNRVQLEPICDFILSIAYNSPEQTFSVCWPRGSTAKSACCVAANGDRRAAFDLH